MNRNSEGVTVEIAEKCLLKLIRERGEIDFFGGGHTSVICE